MPLAGKGMLLTSMDVDPSHEADFNRWYDREHLRERVAIEGFLEARRYVAHRASPKYLCLYSTAAPEVLDGPAYRAALINPTDWSKANLARFKNMIRAIARITISRGEGRGAAALSTADRYTCNSTDHVFEARQICFRPISRIDQSGTIGGTVEHLGSRRGVEAKVFRAGPMRDIAPSLEKSLDCDALSQMLTIVPPVEIGLMGWIDVHRRQQHSFSGERHLRILIQRSRKPDRRSPLLPHP